MTCISAGLGRVSRDDSLFLPSRPPSSSPPQSPVPRLCRLLWDGPREALSWEATTPKVQPLGALGPTCRSFTGFGCLVSALRSSIAAFPSLAHYTPSRAVHDPAPDRAEPVRKEWSEF